MKIVCGEYDHVFSFNLEPETLADAALLVRLKLNARPQTCSVHTYAQKTGISAELWFDKVSEPRRSEIVKTGRET